MKHDVVVGMSSNQQARQRLFRALKKLSTIADIISLSHLYLNHATKSSITAPDYINCVVVVSTSKSLAALTSALKALEKSAGGNRRADICPLDLDIIAFEGHDLDQQERPLPRLEDPSEAYLWCCVQELCPDLVWGGSTPSVWQPQRWPEFEGWHLYNSEIAQRVSQLFVVKA